jgi:probable HAF family extracellular repeat protein
MIRAARALRLSRPEANMTIIRNFILAGSLLHVLALAQTQTRYTVTDLGTLGGEYSYGYAINNRGLVAGGAATHTQSGGLAQTAFLWSRGQLTNLGTLGGAACPGCSSESAASTADGTVAVISETSKMDPSGEDFCGFGTHRQCLAAIWQNGKLSALPMLAGGFNSQVYWINDGGDAVGFSENGTLDVTCAVPFQARRFQAVKWTPDGKLQELPPLAGDTVGFAFGINEKGQTIGVSGQCSNTFIPPVGAPSGPHAVLWESDGRVLDLGTLPGALNYAATAINNRGDVIGNALYEDQTVRPFLWTKKDGMQDLGLAEGDFVTVAPCCGTINNHGDVVAFSCPGPFGLCRAMLWKNHEWTDLNTLVPAGSAYLVSVASINDAGQIVAGDMSGTATHAVVLSPAQTTANAGPKEMATNLKSIQLDGSQSTSADGKDLTYVWSIPQGSPSAAISRGNTATPVVTFSSVRGLYTFQLTVTDSTGKSSTDVATAHFMGH